MDIGVLITALIGVVTTFFSAWISWFFTRKKYNAEVDNTIIDSMKESLKFYQELSDDNKRRLDDAIKRSVELEEEVKRLREQVDTLTMNICLNLTCKERVTAKPKV